MTTNCCVVSVWGETANAIVGFAGVMVMDSRKTELPWPPPTRPFLPPQPHIVKRAHTTAPKIKCLVINSPRCQNLKLRCCNSFCFLRRSIMASCSMAGAVGCILYSFADPGLSWLEVTLLATLLSFCLDSDALSCNFTQSNARPPEATAP